MITLNVVSDKPASITFVAQNIQEILAVSYGSKYRVQIVVVSGRSYFVYDDNNEYEYDTQEDALVAKEALMAKIND